MGQIIQKTNMKLKLLIEISVLVFTTSVLIENQEYSQFPESFDDLKEQAPFVRAVTKNQDDGQYLDSYDNYVRSFTNNKEQDRKEKEDFAVDPENRRRSSSKSKRRSSSQSKRRPSSQSKRRRSSSQSRRRSSSQSKRRPSSQSKGTPSTQSKGRPSSQSKGRPSSQ